MFKKDERTLCQAAHQWETDTISGIPAEHEGRGQEAPEFNSIPTGFQAKNALLVPESQV